MPPRPCSTLVGALLGIAAGVLVLAGCAGAPDTSMSSSGADASSVTGPSPSPMATIAPFPLGESVSTTALPADLPQGCRDILDDAVLAELKDVPLNAPGMGGGIRPDSSRVCVWGEPGAAATRLVTVIGYSPEREARDALYTLGTEGYTCYEPQGGIRCEKTWQNATLPIDEGRTLFWRDGVIIDTQYSNLAPAGYTAAVIDALWPAAGSPKRFGTSAPSVTPTPSTTP